jgi:hypothetical protein
MLASFQPARSNSDIFINSLSNDVVLRAYNKSQRLLFGFGSNVNSTLYLSDSNLSIEKGAIYASNVGIGSFTPNPEYRLHVAGATRIEGDLTVNGTTTTLNTEVKLTEQVSVSNNGTGPALIVTQYGAQSIAEFRDDDVVVLKINDGGYVTIGTNVASTKLDVEGDTTVRGIIYTSNVITSNIQTSSITTTIANLKSITTCNISTSNITINNQLIINSNGVITNSNFLPPFNTSNIVSGQFTSNFILDDNIISSKLASNLVFKGTTTISSNAFINNGDLLVRGSNNFLNIGDQARILIGSNDYFVGTSRGVGLFMQVPGTAYPFILENASGFLGLGTMDPQENLHVRSNAKVDGNHYVMSNLGVGTSNPLSTLEVYGNLTTSSNIKSSVGTLGPSFSLIPESAYADISTGARLILDNTLEAGNPANDTTKPLFYGRSYLYQDTSGENMLWNYARLLFRGCSLASTASSSLFTVQDFQSNRSPQYSNISNSFTLCNEGSSLGYVSYSTPWFTMQSSNARHIALIHNSNTQNEIFRVGQVHIQFKT